MRDQIQKFIGRSIISNKLRGKLFHVLHLLFLLVKECLDESTLAHSADARHRVLLSGWVKQLCGEKAKVRLRKPVLL